MRSTSFTRAHVGMIDMQKTILHAQVDAESRARTHPADPNKGYNGPFILCDRSALDPIVYAHFSTEGESGARELIDGEEIQRLLPDYRTALFVLLHPVAEWIEDDGVRSLDDPYKCPIVFKTVMNNLNISFKEMGGELKGLEDRVDKVLEWMAAKK
ncbi:AAA domain protein [Ceratobasidium sp. AG-Ba]|nr:AAA domain protein [Ceratobasidium sp. AG-Ba]